MPARGLRARHDPQPRAEGQVAGGAGPRRGDAAARAAVDAMARHRAPRARTSSSASAATAPGRSRSPRGCAACPMLLHEQNAQPGLTNRCWRRVARAIAVTYDGRRRRSSATRASSAGTRFAPSSCTSGPSQRGRGRCSSLAAPRARTRSTWPWSRQHRSWRGATRSSADHAPDRGTRSRRGARRAGSRPGSRPASSPSSRHGRGDERRERDRLPRRIDDAGRDRRGRPGGDPGAAADRDRRSPAQERRGARRASAPRSCSSSGS